MKNPLVAVVASFFCLCGPAAWSQAQKFDVPHIIHALEQQQKKVLPVRGIDIESSHETKDFIRVYKTSGAGEDRMPEDRTQQMTWAYEGNKKYRQYVEKFDTKQQHGLHDIISRTNTDIFDGVQHFSIISSIYTGVSTPYVQANLDHRSLGYVSPLSFGYRFQNRWVTDVLREGNYHVDSVSNDPRYGPIYRLSETKRGNIPSHSTGGLINQTSKLWLAPRLGFLVVRSEYEVEAAVPNGHQLLVFKTDQVQKRGAVWFPTAGTMRSLTVEQGKQTLLTEKKMVVTRFSLEPIPASLFNPNLAPGSFVKDGETNRYWKIGSNGEQVNIDIGHNQTYIK